MLTALKRESDLTAFGLSDYSVALPGAASGIVSCHSDSAFDNRYYAERKKGAEKGKF